MVEIGDNWRCSYCGHAQVIDKERFQRSWNAQYVRGWKEQDFFPSVFIQTIVCANSDCQELSLAAVLGRLVPNTNGRQIDGYLHEWRLLPRSSAKPQPAFIPEPLRDDYYEACAIRDLSPKAARYTYTAMPTRYDPGFLRDSKGDLGEGNRCFA
jgi:hypothetical protein